nr:hypothetical protein Iba_chr13cCG11670 [Ipomoea batatas]
MHPHASAKEAVPPPYDKIPPTKLDHSYIPLKGPISFHNSTMHLPNLWHLSPRQLLPTQPLLAMQPLTTHPFPHLLYHPQLPHPSSNNQAFSNPNLLLLPLSPNVTVDDKISTPQKKDDDELLHTTPTAEIPAETAQEQPGYSKGPSTKVQTNHQTEDIQEQDEHSKVPLTKLLMPEFGKGRRSLCLYIGMSPEASATPRPVAATVVLRRGRDPPPLLTERGRMTVKPVPPLRSAIA